MGADPYAIDPKGFGKHLRRLRRTRGHSQEALAKRAGLSSDTIRRLENGALSPSLTTLVGLARGYRLRLSTVLASYETGMLPPERELADLMAGRDEKEIRLLLRIARILLSDP